jgi:hypothetical protein
MKITNVEFNSVEKAEIYLRAVSALILQGVSKKEAKEIVSAETSQNILRLALGFERRKRGGVRPGGFEPGNQWAKRE